MTIDNETHRGRSAFEQSPEGFDLERYMAMLDEPGLTDDQKRSFIGALHGMLQNIIDAAFESPPPEREA